jgi:hypothetical protein
MSSPCTLIDGDQKDLFLVAKKKCKPVAYGASAGILTFITDSHITVPAIELHSKASHCRQIFHPIRGGGKDLWFMSDPFIFFKEPPGTLSATIKFEIEQIGPDARPYFHGKPCDACLWCAHRLEVSYVFPRRADGKVSQPEVSAARPCCANTLQRRGNDEAAEKSAVESVKYASQS